MVENCGNGFINEAAAIIIPPPSLVVVVVMEDPNIVSKGFLSLLFAAALVDCCPPLPVDCCPPPATGVLANGSNRDIILKLKHSNISFNQEGECARDGLYSSELYVDTSKIKMFMVIHFLGVYHTDF